MYKNINPILQLQKLRDREKPLMVKIVLKGDKIRKFIKNLKKKINGV